MNYNQFQVIYNQLQHIQENWQSFTTSYRWFTINYNLIPGDWQSITINYNHTQEDLQLVPGDLQSITTTSQAYDNQLQPITITFNCVLVVIDFITKPLLKSHRHYTHWLYRHCRCIVNKTARHDSSIRRMSFEIVNGGGAILLIKSLLQNRREW